MKETLETKLKKYSEDLQKATAQWEAWGIKIRQLEGAVMACEEMLKELKDEVDR